MLSLSVFLDITKIAELRLINADISRNHGLCHVISLSFDVL